MYMSRQQFFLLIGSICLLLRWGAMDAEVYPEASRTVLKILWDVGTTMCPDHELRWAKARASAFEALSQYEVNFVNVQKFCYHFVTLTGELKYIATCLVLLLTLFLLFRRLL